MERGQERATQIIHSPLGSAAPLGLARLLPRMVSERRTKNFPNISMHARSTLGRFKGRNVARKVADGVAMITGGWGRHVRGRVTQ